MFTQHLTIVQSKHLFLSKECVAYLCESGLNPVDASRLELRPIIVATLCVENFSINWQRLYFADKPMPLASFLYLAWTEFHHLGGLPEQLLVESELLSAYPLRKVISQLDPDKRITKIDVGHGYAFGSTKRNSQGLSRHCINPENGTAGSFSPLKSQEIALARLNECLEAYHRQWEHTPKPGARFGEKEFAAHLDRQVYLPHWPHDLPELVNAEWMQRQCLECLPQVTESQTMKFTNKGWFGLIEPERRSTSLVKPSYQVIPAELMPQFVLPKTLSFHRFVHDIPGLKSMVESLPYPPEQLLGHLLGPTEIELFLRSHLSVSEDLAAEIIAVLIGDYDEEGMVFAPTEYNSFKEIVSFLGSRNHIGQTAQLVCGKTFNFGVIAFDFATRLFLLVIPRGFIPAISILPHLLLADFKLLHMSDPGMAAINYIVTLLVQEPTRYHCKLLNEMVGEMLRYDPRWTRQF